MIVILAYYCVLTAGLAAMLVDDLGWLAFATYYLWMPLGAIGVWRLSGRRIADLGIRLYPDGARHMVWGAAAAASVAGLIVAVLVAAGWADTPGLTWTARRIMTGLIVQQGIVAVLEELAFRGVMQPALSAAWGERRGLAGTAILFGLFHLPNIAYQNVPHELVPLTAASLSVMGVAFGLACRLTQGRLALPVGLHFGWNVIAFGFADAAAPTFTGPQWIAGSARWFPESGLLGLAGLMVLSMIVYRSLAHHDDAGIAHSTEYSQE